MNDTTCITVLPIGEFDTELVRREFEAICSVFEALGAALFVADAVSDDEGARKFGQKFSEDDLDLLLIVTLRGLSAPIIETTARTSRVPCLIWPVQGRYALPSSALALGALREAGLPVELHYAPLGQEGSMEALRSITRAAKAYSRLRKSHIGVVGKLFRNLVACRYDPRLVRVRLGVTLAPITFPELQEAMQSAVGCTGEVEQLRTEIAASYMVDAEDVPLLDEGIKLHLALKRIAQDRQLDGFAAECWSGFPTQLGLNPCLGFFEDAYALACEGDVMLCISLLTARYLTSQNVYAGDLYDVSLDGIVTLIHCGGPASLASNKKEVMLAQSQLARERGFATMTCRPLLKPGLVTMFRLYGRECDKLHVALGEVVDCDRSSNLTVKVKLNGLRDEFLRECTGNHYLVVPGDIRRELNLLGKWLKISLFNT